MFFYWVTRNAQGDVTALVHIDQSGNAENAVSYYYSAFGEIYSYINQYGSNDYSLIANANPILFKGYYYDRDLNMYNLGSRFYDPEVGRFLSGDGELSNVGGNILGYNLFAYCMNNPINMSDERGNWPNWATKLVAAVAVVAVVAVVVAVSVATVGVGTTLIAAGIGATIGVVGKYVEDVTYNAAIGKEGLDMLKPTSSWQDYASSGISSAVSGMFDVVAPGSSKVAKNAIDAVLKPMVKLNLEVASGVTQDYDYRKMAWDATKRYGTSFLKAPGNYTSYSGINKMIGNLPCNMARGGIKYSQEKLIPISG